MTIEQAYDVRAGDVIVERATGKWLDVLTMKYRRKGAMECVVFVCRDNVGARVEVEHRKVRRP